MSQKTQKSTSDCIASSFQKLKIGDAGKPKKPKPKARKNLTKCYGCVDCSSIYEQKSRLLRHSIAVHGIKKDNFKYIRLLRYDQNGKYKFVNRGVQKSRHYIRAAVKIRTPSKKFKYFVTSRSIDTIVAKLLNKIYS